MYSLLVVFWCPSFLLVPLSFVYAAASNSFRWLIRLFIEDFSCFLRKSCIAKNFPLRTALLHPIDFGKLYFHFHLSWGIFWFHLWFYQWPMVFLFCIMLFNLHILVHFPIFLLQLIFSFILLQLGKKMIDIISLLLNLLRLILWPIPRHITIKMSKIKNKTIKSNMGILMKILADF